ncbi:MAG: CoA-binding protein [Sulfuricurvum sp.]|nr:CoA-binding protein [Sulfuricurvum sp.]
MECDFPTINANNNEIQSIFAEVKTIAVLGLSPDPTKDSYRVAHYLQNVGYTIIPVYPKEDLILGEKVYRSLEEIPFPVDMVNIFRKPDALNPIVDSCMKRGDVKVFWAQKGIVNNEAAQRAQNAGMQVVQNHCSMVEHHLIYG